MQNSDERYYDYMLRKHKEARLEKEAQREPDEIALLKERIKRLEIDVAHLQNKSIPSYGQEI